MDLTTKLRILMIYCVLVQMVGINFTFAQSAKLMEAQRQAFTYRGGSVFLNKFCLFYKWISTPVMLRPGLAADD